jgi:hypothetical protein
MSWRNLPLLKTAALTAASLFFVAGPASAQHHGGQGGHHGGGYHGGHGGHHGGHGGYYHGGGPGHGGYGGHYGYHRHGYYPGYYGGYRHHGYSPGLYGFGVGLGYAYPYGSYGYNSYPYYDTGYLTPAYRGYVGVYDDSYVAPPALPQAPWGPAGYRRASPDRPEDLVRSWYRTYLNREPDPQWAVWVDAVRNGQEPNSVLASILSSQEYYDKAGGTPEGFVQTLFRDVTGRRPTPSEMDYWVRRTYDRDRTDVAYAVLTR